MDKYDIVGALVIIGVILLVVYYALWQYNNCMDKFDDFWYCFKHAT